MPVSRSVNVIREEVRFEARKANALLVIMLVLCHCHLSLLLTVFAVQGTVKPPKEWASTPVTLPVTSSQESNRKPLCGTILQRKEGGFKCILFFLLASGLQK